MFGRISHAPSNGALLLDSRSQDFIVSTSSLNQKILMGFSSNVPSSFALGRSNATLGNTSSNVYFLHYGNMSNEGHINVSQNLVTSNAFIDHMVGIGASTFDSNIRLYVAGDTRIEGDLIVNGNISSIDTTVTVTDEFQVTNLGTGPALLVNQLGSTPIVSFQSQNNPALYITSTGYAAVGHSNPTQRLDILGNAMIRGNVTACNISVSNASFTNINITSNATIDASIITPTAYLDNLYMGNKLIIDSSGIITNSNYVPTLDTTKIQYGTFTSNFIKDYNITSAKLESNITLVGTTYVTELLGVNTSNPTYGNPFVRFKVENGDAFITGQNSFKQIADQARIYLGDGSHFVAASCNVGLVMQVPNTTFPFVLEANSGYLGLGTMDPEERLHVANNAKIANNAYIMNRLGIAHSNPLETLSVQGNMSLSNNGKIVLSTSNDNMGISTATPIAKLHVKTVALKDALYVETAA